MNTSLLRIVMPLLTVALTGLPVLSAAATQTWVIATADASAQAGAPITLDVFKPEAAEQWPAAPKLRLEQDGSAHEIELSALEPATADGLRRSYRGVVPPCLSGLVRVRLADIPSNRLALLITVSGAAEIPQSASGKTTRSSKTGRPG